MIALDARIAAPAFDAAAIDPQPRPVSPRRGLRGVTTPHPSPDPSPIIRGACWVVRSGRPWISAGPRPATADPDDPDDIIFAWDAHHLVVGPCARRAHIVSRAFYAASAGVYRVDDRLGECVMRGIMEASGVPSAHLQSPVFGDPWEDEVAVDDDPCGIVVDGDGTPVDSRTDLYLAIGGSIGFHFSVPVGATRAQIMEKCDVRAEELLRGASGAVPATSAPSGDRWRAIMSTEEGIIVYALRVARRK